ncbi:hypothetical protein H4S02_004575 [Coemansia sp. RSA 2611]|nr:hypothetical protein H4S02_004575 [Coemansia sp. RSA 2611]
MNSNTGAAAEHAAAPRLAPNTYAAWPAMSQLPPAHSSYMLMMQQLQAQPPRPMMAPPHSAPIRPADSASSTAQSTPALASAALQPASEGAGPAASAASSPALSTKARPRASPKAKREPKRRAAPGKKPRAVTLRQPQPQLAAPQPARTTAEALGAGLVQLEQFHNAFAERAGPRSLDFWNAVVARSFADGGSVKLELGGQRYEMPAAAAGRFYHRLFTEGGVQSIRLALNDSDTWLVGADTALAFRAACMTTTYASGRRVVEHGVLRVYLAHSLRMRAWAFESREATVLLPRKRISAADDLLIRTADATIARNLDWPHDTPPPPRRRKSAHGRQPADECALPACGLQHLEIAHTVGLMQDLFALQAQHAAAPVADVLRLWTAAVNPAPATSAGSALPASKPAERKRARKRSTAAAAAPKDTAEPVSAKS